MLLWKACGRKPPCPEVRYYQDGSCKTSVKIAGLQPTFKPEYEVRVLLTRPVLVRRKLKNNFYWYYYYYCYYWYCYCGLGSVVCIATGYGLDGPGIESRWGLDFPHLSRPALGLNHPPVQWVTVLYPRGKEWLGRDPDHSPPSSTVVKKAIPLLPLWAVWPVQCLRAVQGCTLHFLLLLLLLLLLIVVVFIVITWKKSL
jgi:hypothetical protein